MQLWQIHVAEQAIMDDIEINPDKYEGKKLSELTDEEEFDEENSVQYTQDYYKETLLNKRIVVSILRLANHFACLIIINFFSLFICITARECKRSRLGGCICRTPGA